MILVVDASVVLKWFLGARPDEAEAPNALDILRAVGAGRVRMVQPPHFLAEVAAVLARELPATAGEDLVLLQTVEWDVDEGPWIYATAVELSMRLRHHVFDTLYHATALHHESAILVTADEAYYEKAHAEGGIVRLRDFAAPA